MPVLMCLGEYDLQASSRYAAHIASLMPRVEIRRYPVGHFDVYLGSLCDEISSTQAAFFTGTCADLQGTHQPIVLLTWMCIAAALSRAPTLPAVGPPSTPAGTFRCADAAEAVRPPSRSSPWSLRVQTRRPPAVWVVPPIQSAPRPSFWTLRRTMRFSGAR